MAERKAAQTDPSDAIKTTGTTGTTGDVIEQKVVAFAEQLGSLVGTVQAKAEGWLDREALSRELGRIRDGAADLLNQLNRTSTEQRKKAAKQPAKSAARPSRGPVDAPGKRHRKPPPQERLAKRMGEPEGKKMGQKSAQMRKPGGRG